MNELGQIFGASNMKALPQKNHMHPYSHADLQRTLEYIYTRASILSQNHFHHHHGHHQHGHHHHGHHLGHHHSPVKLQGNLR